LRDRIGAGVRRLWRVFVGVFAILADLASC
jgi:hypothetical protein